MNAITFLARPLPQAQPPQAGGVPASRSQAPSGKDEDRPAFTPSDSASVAEAQALANEPSTPANRSDAAKTPALEPAEAVATGTDDAAVSTEPRVAASANGNALLIAQAVAAAPPTPMAVSAVTTTSVAALAVAAQPGAATTIAAAGKQIRQGASPSPSPTPIPSPSTAAAQTDTDIQVPSAQPAAPAPRPVAPNVSPDTAKPPQGASDASNANKPNALNTLLDAPKPQNAPSATGQPATPTATPSTAPTAMQPMAPTAAPSPTQSATPQATQSAQASAVPADALAPIFGGTDSDGPSPARATADAPTAPSISFGTDLGAAAHAKTATAAYEAVRAAAPIVPASEQVAMQIHRAIEDGIDKLTVELKPASLGRVQAEIQFQNDHRVHVVLSADRPATLDALRSDARALERALQDAGLRADAGSLSFRFENGGGQSGFTSDGASDDLFAPAARGARDTAPLALAAYATVARPGGIDIRV